MRAIIVFLGLVAVICTALSSSIDKLTSRTGNSPTVVAAAAGPVQLLMTMTGDEGRAAVLHLAFAAINVCSACISGGVAM